MTSLPLLIGSLLVLHLDFNTVQMKKESVVDCLRVASKAGYNAVLWEIENKVRWETCPECVHPEAFTKDEFREILSESERLGLEPIPLMQTFGHAEYVLSQARYAGWRESTNSLACYCVSKPEVSAFQKALLREYLDLFGNRVRRFHLGGDEALVFGTCEDCRRHGKMDLYVKHLEDVSGALLEKGIRPGVWADMVILGGDWNNNGKGCVLAETIGKLPKSFTLWNWDYSYGTKGYKKGNALKTEQLTGLGYEVILCAASQSFSDSPFLPRFRRHRDNIAACADLARKNDLAGFCLTSWSVHFFPKSVQYPLWEFAAKRYADPSVDFQSVLESRWKGVPFDVLDRLSDWDGAYVRFDVRIRGYEKPAIPACPGELAERLKVLDEENGRPLLLASAKKDLRRIEGSLAELKACSAPVDDVRLLEVGGSLNATFLRSLSSVLGKGTASECARKDAVSYYEHWQPPWSASNAAALAWSVLEQGVSVSRSKGGWPSSAIPASDEVEVRVRSTDGVPRIHVDGRAIAPHMFWGRTATVPRLISPEWKQFDVAVTPRVDIRRAFIRFRMEEEAGLVQVRGCSFLEGVREQRVMPDLSAKKSLVPYVVTDAAGVTTIDLRSFRGREQELPALAVCLPTTCATLRRGTTYHLRFEARGEGISWIRACLHQQESGPYKDWVGEIPPDDRSLSVGWRQARKAAAAGVNLVSFLAPHCWCPESEMQTALDALDLACDTYIDANPNVLLVPRLSLNAQDWWLRANRDQCMVMESGKTNDYPSVSSEVYRRDAVAYVRRVIRHLRSRYPRHFAGIHFSGQNSGEWFYADAWQTLGGYDRPTETAWRDWLARHGYADARRACVPSSRERRTSTGPSRLWDPMKDRRLIEFNRFLQDEMADFVAGINRVCRQETAGKKLVVSFYGYGWELLKMPAGPAGSGHYALGKLLERGRLDVDILAAPFSYDPQARGWLGSSPVMSAAETVTANGILWMNEDDSRTHLNHSRVGNCRVVKTEDLGQTLDLLRRNTVANAVRGQGSWWMDLVGNGWFDDVRLWQVVAEFRDRQGRSKPRSRSFAPDVVCIMDEESMLNLMPSGHRISKPLLQGTRQDVPHLGASWGQYLLSDVLTRNLRARLELYLACWCMSEGQVAACERRRMVDSDVMRVWCWNSGYFGDGGRSPERMARVTGFSVRELSAAYSCVRATPLGKAAGWPDACELSASDPAGGEFLPCLALDAAPEETLAVWPDGSPAVAWRRNPGGVGWSVAVGFPKLPRQFLRTLVERSGAHLWFSREQMDDFTLNASHDLVWLQAQRETTGAIEPPAELTDAFTGDPVRREDLRTLHLRRGEVRAWNLENVKETSEFEGRPMKSDLAIWDYAVIGAFFAVMIGVGVYYSRKSKSSDQFFGNDKSVPWWLSGVSFYMNSFSALAFVMYSALAYKFGWVPVTVSWLSVPAVLLGAWFLAVRWRRAAKGSPIDYIAERYTPGMCRTLAILGLPMQLLDNALKLLAIGTVVGVGMGFPLFWSICISGVIIVLYTFLGGLKATLTCDFIQFLVILAVVFTLPFLCLERLAACGPQGTAGPTGVAGLVEGFKVFLDKVPAGFFDFTAGKYTWVYMLVFFCCVGSTLSTNWSLVQRYYSTKSEKDAKKMAYLIAVLLFVGPPIFFFPAMAARIFLPGIPDAEMNGVYALLCREVLPVGMIGMVIAAMFSATMSSLAGNFNAAAAVITDALKMKSMFAARVATIVVGGLVIALTFVMQYAQGADDLFNLSNKVFGVFLPPIAIPMLCGIFVRKFSKRSGLMGLVGGIAVGLVIFVVGAKPELAYLREMIWIFPMTAAATMVFLVIGTVSFPDKPEERAAVESFFRVFGKIVHEDFFAWSPEHLMMAG